MTRIRQWVLTAVLTALLALSFASVASADPGDGGFSARGGRPVHSTASSDPGDGGW